MLATHAPRRPHSSQLGGRSVGLGVATPAPLAQADSVGGRDRVDSRVSTVYLRLSLVVES